MNGINRGIRYLLALGVVLAISAGTPAMARADEEQRGSIAGVWREAGQVPADAGSDISLWATAAGPDFGVPDTPCDIDPTNAEFLCLGLPAGQYLLRGTVYHYFGEVAQGLFGAADGGPISVAARTSTTGVLVDWAIISGTYTSGGAALPSYGWFKAKAHDALSDQQVAEEYRRNTELHGSDQFRLRVAPGSYRIQFDTRDRAMMEEEWGSMWESQWYPGVPQRSQSQVVTVGAGDSIQINPDLRALSSIYGSGQLGRQIEALDLSGRIIRQTTSDAWGSWVIADLPLGSYKIRFREFMDEDEEPASWSWFHDGSDFQSAHILTLRYEGQRLRADGPTVPTPPQGIDAAGGQESVSISWSPPARDGGKAVTSFTAQAGPTGPTCTTTSLSCTITDLRQDAVYQVSVVAHNDIGASHPSEQITVRTLPAAAQPVHTAVPEPQPAVEQPQVAAAGSTPSPQSAPVTVGAPSALSARIAFRSGTRRDGALKAVISGLAGIPGSTVVLHWCNTRISGSNCDPLQPDKKRGSTTQLAADGSVKLNLAARKCRSQETSCARSWGKLRTKKADRVRIVAVIKLPEGYPMSGTPALVRL